MHAQWEKRSKNKELAKHCEGAIFLCIYGNISQVFKTNKQTFSGQFRVYTAFFKAQISIQIITLWTCTNKKSDTNFNVHLSGYPSEFRGHIQLTSFRLTLENTSLWLLEQTTVGRSEQAKTLVVDRERNVCSTVGWVPSVTFLRSVKIPRKQKQSNRPKEATQDSSIKTKRWN